VLLIGTKKYFQLLGSFKIFSLIHYGYLPLTVWHQTILFFDSKLFYIHPSKRLSRLGGSVNQGWVIIIIGSFGKFRIGINIKIVCRQLFYNFNQKLVMPACLKHVKYYVHLSKSNKYCLGQYIYFWKFQDNLKTLKRLWNDMV
jgi:hypothetical protein